MSLLQGCFQKFVVIEGEARGADLISKNCAKQLGLEWKEYPALWEKFGKAAGPIRNRQMVTEGRAQAVVAFHPAIQFSKGTKDMVEFAVSKALPTIVLTGNENLLTHKPLSDFIQQLERIV